MNFLLVRLVLWLITLAVFPIPVALVPYSFQVEVLGSIQPAGIPPSVTESASLQTLHAFPVITAVPALPPGECERVEWTERVLVYLEQAEKKEIDPWLRDDYRIAWITTKWSQHGVPDWAWHRNSPPYTAATYQVLNCLPDEVWPRIVAKRKEKLGSEYARFYDAGDNRLPEVAPVMVAGKKPCASERRRKLREQAASGKNLAA